MFRVIRTEGRARRGCFSCAHGAAVETPVFMNVATQAAIKGGEEMDDFTRRFNIAKEKDAEIRRVLSTVYEALEEKGYNPINQIVGYILSEDPTYITNHNSARTLIRKIDRDELLQVLVRYYLHG